MNNIFRYSSCRIDNCTSSKRRFFVNIISSDYNTIGGSKSEKKCNLFRALDFDSKDTFNLVILTPLLKKSEIDNYNLANRLIFKRLEINDCEVFYSSYDLEKAINNNYPIMVGHFLISEE